MSIAWETLIDVRERRKQLALAAMVAERRIVEQSRAQTQLAQAEQQRCIDAKSRHWQSIRDAAAQGAVNVARLCDAVAWSNALDAGISRHNTIVQQAQADTTECEQRLVARSHSLRQAVAGLMKAEQMRERRRAQQRLVSDARADSAIDDFASITWAGRQVR